MGLSQSDAGLPDIFPDDPKIVMAEALSRYDEGQPRALSEAQSGARFNLFEDEPRLLIARTLSNRGEVERSNRLLEEARRLNPRSRETRLLLLQQYILLGNGKGIAEETSALHNLAPKGRVWFTNLLASYSLNPVTSRDVLAALPSHPAQIPVLEALAKDPSSKSVLLIASRNLRGRAKLGEVHSWVSNIVMPFVQRGDIEGARHLWSHFFAVDVRQVAIPFDSEFNDLAGAPFGWAAPPSVGGTAEIGNGTLDLEFFGRKPAIFVQQLVTLAPGTYRLRYDAIRANSGTGAGLFWKIRCVQNAELLRSPIQLNSAMTTRRSETFSVPDKGCAAQWLALEGEPLIDARPVSASVESIAIERM